MPIHPDLPTVATMPLSLILVGCNSVTSAAARIEAWRVVLAERLAPFEIVFVDDGSTDRTAEAVETLRDSIPDLQVHRHDKPRGFGAAMRTGLAAAVHPLLAVAPCHEAYRPEDLPAFLKAIERHHFVIGYRAAWPMPVPLRFLGTGWRMLWRVLFSVSWAALPGWLGWRGHLADLAARAFFGTRLHDVACPFRVLRREVLARSPLQCDGAFALIEQVAKVNFGGYLFSEALITLPATPPTSPFADQPAGRPFRDGRNVFFDPKFGPVQV